MTSLSCQEFFRLYLGDDSEYSFGKFLHQKGELNIKEPLWAEPSKEDLAAVNIPALKVKKLKADFQIKNNPFVKVAPTTKTFNLCVNTDTKILLRVLNKTSDVPYCDSFAVEEEWYIASLPNSKCSVVRITMGIVWYKSTMMKGMIKSGTESESLVTW